MSVRKVLIIVGSPRKKETWAIVNQFGQELSELNKVVLEYIVLKDLRIEQCRGCFLCLTKGEEICPNREDDMLSLIDKMMAADGVVFATPNYSLQVTAIMKNFLDRMAFTFHRPQFFHKKFTCIVTQGATGGADIVKYLKKVATYTGFIYVPGFHVTTVSPRTSSEQKAIDRNVNDLAERFSKALSKGNSPKPPLKMVLIFRMVRSMYKTTPDLTLKDVRYFRDNGWFESSYFYPVRLGPIGHLTGFLADSLGKKFAIKRKREMETQS